MKKKIAVAASLILLLLSMQTKMSAQCPSSNNTFVGTTNSDWNIASNWSECCVPVSPVTGFISIEANCTLGGTASYTFNSGSTFQIKAGVTFTNNSSGTWTMNGSTFGAGTYVGNETISGPIKPGYVTPPPGSMGSITYGGQTYATKLMPDGKWWMVENLNIGTMVTGTTEMTSNGVIEKYCYDDNPANCATYGGLYQWDEMMQYVSTQGAQGVCPAGWHVYTAGDWNGLQALLPSPDKGSRLAGNAALWTDGALDQSAYFGTSCFQILPSGCRNPGGSFSGLTMDAFSWSSNDVPPYYLAVFRALTYGYTNVSGNELEKSYGFAVRCVQD